MEPCFVLGIDGGTGGLRSMVFDRQGTVISKCDCEYPTAYPQAGYAEQNAEDWIRAAERSISRVAAEVNGEIAAICAATTSCTVICCTKEGQVLAPAILWMDIRADEQRKRIQKITGQVLSAESFICKALWIKEHQPELWQRTEVLCEYQDYLNYWLTGTWCISANTACNWGYNNREKHFAEDFLKKIQLQDMLNKIPQHVVCAGERIAEILPDIAVTLGIDRGSHVVQGGIDSSIGMLGMGTVRPGSLSLMTGSSNLAMAVTEKPLFMPEDAVNSGPDFLLRGYYTSVQGQTASGSLLRWFLREFCRDMDEKQAYAQLDAAAAKISAGSNGVLVLDYWQGNRHPHNDANATGVICGLTMNTTREHIYRGVMESIAYGTRDILNAFSTMGFSVNSINVSGGSTRSDIFMQIYADVCGVPFRVASDYSVALGAAILAATEYGWYDSVPEAVDAMVRFQKVYYPNVETERDYNNGFARYKALYYSLKQGKIF